MNKKYKLSSPAMLTNLTLGQTFSLPIWLDNLLQDITQSLLCSQNPEVVKNRLTSEKKQVGICLCCGGSDYLRVNCGTQNKPKQSKKIANQIYG